LAGFNRGLCLVTTRLPVADLADHEGTSVLRRDLEHLSSQAGAQLLQALGVRGPEAEMRRASDEFHGASSCAVNGLWPGRKATGGFTIIIGHLRLSCRTV
jgi:hypothetical protein